METRIMEYKDQESSGWKFQDYINLNGTLKEYYTLFKETYARYGREFHGEIINRLDFTDQYAQISIQSSYADIQSIKE
jgi:hypothetical protein